MSSSWCTIESDPGVFSELVEQLGVTGIQVEELFTLEPEDFARIEPIYGLVFLFKWKGEDDESRQIAEFDPKTLFFANQIINNACATQALLSILLNLEERSEVDIGDELKNFKEFSAEFPPDMKGLAISNSEKIRTVHNSFSRPEPFIPEERKAEEGDDVFHFIAYLPKNGRLYELDGLKSGPIDLGAASTEDWVGKVIPEIQARVSRYSQSEIHFNLLALSQNKISLCEEGIAETEKLLSGYDAVEMETGEEEDREKEKEKEKKALQSKLAQLKERLQIEKEKREMWTKENMRRRHNYIPFIVQFLKFLAEKDMLRGLVADSEEKDKQSAKSRKKVKK